MRQSLTRGGDAAQRAPLRRCAALHRISFRHFAPHDESVVAANEASSRVGWHMLL